MVFSMASVTATRVWVGPRRTFVVSSDIIFVQWLIAVCRIRTAWNWYRLWCDVSRICIYSLRLLQFSHPGGDSFRSDGFAGPTLYENGDRSHYGILLTKAFRDLVGGITEVEIFWVVIVKDNVHHFATIQIGAKFAQRGYKLHNELLCPPSHTHIAECLPVNQQPTLEFPWLPTALLSRWPVWKP